MKFIGITLIVAAVFLVIAVLLQSSKEKGMSSALSGTSDTYYGKNKGSSRDYILNKLTIVVAIIFSLLVIVSFVIQKDKLFETGWKDFQEGMKDKPTTEVTTDGSTTAGDTTAGDTTNPDTTTAQDTTAQ